MTHFSSDDEELIRRLNAHPSIRNRIVSILSAVEDEAGNLRLADDAEMRMIEEMRHMGQEALQAWATRQIIERSQEVSRGETVWREGKKNCTGTPPLAT